MLPYLRIVGRCNAARFIAPKVIDVLFTLLVRPSPGDCCGIAVVGDPSAVDLRIRCSRQQKIKARVALGDELRPGYLKLATIEPIHEVFGLFFREKSQSPVAT